MKYKYLILIAIVVTIIFIPVLYLGFQKSPHRQIIENNNTTGLQAYRNEDIGFEVMYDPEIISVYEKDNFVAFHNSIYADAARKLESWTMPVLSVELIEDNPSSITQEWLDERSLSLELAQGFGTFAGRYVFHAQGEEMLGGVPHYISPRDKGVIIIMDLLSREGKYADAYGVIRDSFTFIESSDTSGWLTYRNEDYGFEFNYPPGSTIETRTDLNYESVRIQKHNNADDRPGLAEELYWLEIFIFDQEKGHSVSDSCDKFVVEGREVEQGTSIVHRGISEPGPYRDYRYTLCTIRPSMALHVAGYENDINAPIVNAIFDSFQFVEEVTDKSDWKLYLNEPLKVSFDYPTRWNDPREFDVDIDHEYLREFPEYSVLDINLIAEDGAILKFEPSTDLCNRGECFVFIHLTRYSEDTPLELHEYEGIAITTNLIEEKELIDRDSTNNINGHAWLVKDGMDKIAGTSEKSFTAITSNIKIYIRVNHREATSREFRQLVTDAEQLVSSIEFLD